MCRRAAVLIVTLGLLGACSARAPASPTDVPPPTSPPVAPAPTDVPAATEISPPPTAEPIPPDSLTTVELYARLNPLTEAEPGCDLPCYGGLTPGDSPMADVFTFYARLGVGEQDLIPGDVQSAADGSGRLGAGLNKATDVQPGAAVPLVDIGVEEGIVQSVYVGWPDAPADLTPAAVFDALGEPAEIDLAIDAGAETPFYLLRLAYPDLRSGFAFRGALQAGAGTQDACLSVDGLERAFFGTFAPEQPIMAGLANEEMLLPLRETLGMSYDDLAALAAAGGCLSLTPEQVALWPIPVTE